MTGKGIAWKALITGITLLGILPIRAQAQAQLPCWTCPSKLSLSTCHSVSTMPVSGSVQRVDIIHSGQYTAMGDLSPQLVEGVQPAAYNPNELKRMTITAWPNHMKVVTGINPTDPQPVAYVTKPYSASVIDVVYDANVNYDTRQRFGTRADGTYAPFPQTPDITVNTRAQTVSVDNHL